MESLGGHTRERILVKNASPRAKAIDREAISKSNEAETDNPTKHQEIGVWPENSLAIRISPGAEFADSQWWKLVGLRRVGPAGQAKRLTIPTRPM